MKMLREVLRYKPRWTSLGISAAAVCLVLSSVAPAAAAPTAASSAAGESVQLNLLPLLGSGVSITSGPLPTISGSAPPTYGQQTSVASLGVQGPPALGNILSTGVVTVEADAALTAGDESHGHAEVDNPSLGLAGLLTLHATQIVSDASIGGSCGSGLTTSGSSQLTGAHAGGTLGLGLNLLANPAPNTELLNLLGIRVVLNEQITSGDGVNTASVTVNAVHVYLDNTVLSLIGALSGDLFIAQAQASINCSGLADQAAVSITKTATPSPATVGLPLTYTLTVNNAGPQAAANVTVTDPLPASVTLVSATPSVGSCSGTATITCNLGALADTATATVLIVVIPNQAGAVVNSASVASSTQNPNPGGTNASTSTTVNPVVGSPEADLSVSGSAAPNPVVAGNPLTYNIVVGNAGPDGADGVTVSDPLPAGLTLVSATSGQGSCSGTTTVTCDIGTIAAGGQVTVVIVATPANAGPLSNTVSAAATTDDPTPGNNSDTFTVTVDPQGGGGTTSGNADLAMSVGATPSPVATGGQITYVLTASDGGPNGAADVVVTDVIPSGTTLVSAVSSQGGSCTGTTTIVCNLGTLAPNASATVTLVVTAGSAGTAVNTASVTSSAPDPNPDNNQVTTNTTVQAATATANLVLTGTAAPSPGTVGGLLTYTLTVTNQGPDTASGTSLTAMLAQGTSLVTVSAGQGTCSGSTTISCALGTIASGSSAVVTLVVSLSQAGSITLSANTASSASDPTPGNNSITVVTVVNAAVAGGPCVPSAHVLCLDNQPGDGRFMVTTSYATSQSGGLSGPGTAVSMDSLGLDHGGLFWFFEDYNPEMLIKVINACSMSQTFWVFYAAGTNVGLVTTVTDTVTGQARVYTNSDLNAAPPIQDVTAFACTQADLGAAAAPHAATAHPAATSETVKPAAGGGCSSSATTLCIADRFQIQVTYDTTQGGGQTGSGQDIQLTTLNLDRGGIFWFFDSSNPEMLIKVLDACSLEQTYWVFYSATTNVGFTVTVLDTQTGHTVTYHNTDLTAAVPVQDTSALPCN